MLIDEYISIEEQNFFDTEKLQKESYMSFSIRRMMSD
jgi:hypothetical protein